MDCCNSYALRLSKVFARCCVFFQSALRKRSTSFIIFCLVKQTRVHWTDRYMITIDALLRVDMCVNARKYSMPQLELKGCRPPFCPRVDRKFANWFRQVGKQEVAAFWLCALPFSSCIDVEQRTQQEPTTSAKGCRPIEKGKCEMWISQSKNVVSLSHRRCIYLFARGKKASWGKRASRKSGGSSEIPLVRNWISFSIVPRGTFLFLFGAAWWLPWESCNLGFNLFPGACSEYLMLIFSIST